VQAITAVQGHHCGKGPIAVRLREEAPKSLARDVLWNLPTLASKALLKATKGLRSAFELYKRGGYRQSISPKNLHSAVKHKGDYSRACGRAKHR
jgi:hypothetical protein